MIIVVFSLITPFMLIEPPDLVKKKKLQKIEKERQKAQAG